VLLAGRLSIWTLLALNLALLAVVAYAAHSRLAASRPAPEHLTTFYLVIAMGGAAGGLVNGLVAPVLFDRVLEYPLAVAAVPLLLLGLPRKGRGRLENRYGPWVATAVALVLITMALYVGPALLAGARGTFRLVVALVLVSLVGWIAYRRPAGLVAGMLTAMVLLDSFGGQDVIARDRTFYGSYEVSEYPDGRSLRHGTTLHGFQLDESPTTPTSYYSRSGPLGDVMETMRPRVSGVVGLGTGTIAAYGRPGDDITFYEIDQAVVDVASDPTYFTFLRDSPAAVDVRVGDGRLLLESASAGGFDLLVLDAFSSDAIPVHLLTHEAFTLYASRVDQRGAIAVHVSNRVFDLAPVTTSAADHVGWSVLSASGGDGPGATPSTWVLLTPNDELVDRLVGSGWRPLAERDGVAWTDDYSSVLDVLK
jgi:hypothetical protein